MVEAEVGPRERIVLATYRLLAEGGRDAVSTRAVTAAAGVQVPTIYRQFGDMTGLLTEVANFGFRKYLADKHATRSSSDPIADLSRGWDSHVAFGLAEPAVYALLYGDPRPGPRPTAVGEARSILRTIVHRVAVDGHLQVSVDQAVNMVDATGAGVVLNLLGSSPQDRDLTLSSSVRDAVLASITTGTESTDSRAAGGSDLLPTRAVGLKAVLDTADGRLSAAELYLMNEWLDRLSTPVAT